jgi:hypothetical protein
LLALAEVGIVEEMNDANTNPTAALKTALEKNPSAGAPAEQPETALVDPAVQEAQQRQDLAALETKSNQADAVQIEQQLTDLHKLTQAVDQPAATAKTSTSAEAVQPPTHDAGIDIRQLERTKV